MTFFQVIKKFPIQSITYLNTQALSQKEAKDPILGFNELGSKLVSLLVSKQLLVALVSRGHLSQLWVSSRSHSVWSSLILRMFFVRVPSNVEWFHSLYCHSTGSIRG